MTRDVPRSSPAFCRRVTGALAISMTLTGCLATRATDDARPVGPTSSIASPAPTTAPITTPITTSATAPARSPTTAQPTRAKPSGATPSRRATRRSLIPARTAANDARLTEIARRLLGDRPFQVALVRDSRLLAITPGAKRPQRAASLAKTLTALTVMELVERHLLRLDMTIRDATGLSTDDRYANVTVRQLLAHQSGLPDDRAEWFGGHFDNCPKAAAVALSRAGNPVGRYWYSNTNYCLLSLAISAATGQPYPDAVARFVLRPLGITSAVYDPRYVRLEGAGAWRLSAVDAARVLATVDPDNPHARLISQRHRRAMVRPTSIDYGLGVWRFPDGAWGHSGSLNSARNLMVHLPNGDIVVILTQADQPASGLDLYDEAAEISAAFGVSAP